MSKSNISWGLIWQLRGVFQEGEGVPVWVLVYPGSLVGAFGFTLAEANCQHRWVEQQNRSGQAMESCNAVKMRPTQ